MTNRALAFFRKLHVYQQRNFKHDFVASIIVFLVAIPLCLGIALASGAPLLSGIISGILGGIVVGSLSGSQVSVSGPAAGMAAVVLATISQLGDFNTFLLAVFFAGLLQIVLGALRSGFVADYVPSHVIQGLLCAIGVLLIIKQLPLAFTLSTTLAELKMHLLETTEGFSLQPLYEISFHINSGAMLLSLLSFATLLYFDKTHNHWLKLFPGPIVVVIIGILLNEFFILSDSYLQQTSPQLVNIPEHAGLFDLINQLEHPNWSAWNNPQVYLYGLVIAIVASLESLLNIKAGEKLDRSRRYCSKDQELLAQGAGNLIAGLMGGIPITSVVVRTSVNIQTGAKTKASTIMHGFFILIAVILLPETLNKIPISSLAAILIYTGYKLTKPSIYLNIYKQGMDRFVPFIVTMICVVAFNILIGILIGLLVSLFYILQSNSKARLDIIQEIYPNGITNRLILPQQTTFLNKASLVAELNTIPRDSQLIIDARYSEYIDKETIEFLKEFKEELAPLKNISLNFIGFKEKYNIHDHINFINVTTYDIQSMLEPSQVLNILREGNQRFSNETEIHRSAISEIKQTAKMQHPIAVVLGCIDSRVPVETIFDMSFGDLFCARVAGQVINNDILASIEYACNVVGAKLIVVLGHTRCGAIQAACDGVVKGHITGLLAKIQPAIVAETETKKERSSSNVQFIKNVTEFNVALSLLHIYQGSAILKTMIDKDEIGLVGALYDVTSGVVHFKDYSKEIMELDAKTGKLLATKLGQVYQNANVQHQETNTEIQ